jgi:hypothetical protein
MVHICNFIMNNIENAARDAAANLEKSNLEALPNDFVVVTTLIPVSGNAFVTDQPSPK